MVIGLQVTEIEKRLLTCFHVAPVTTSDGKKGLGFLRILQTSLESRIKCVTRPNDKIQHVKIRSAHK